MVVGVGGTLVGVGVAATLVVGVGTGLVAVGAAALVGVGGAVVALGVGVAAGPQAITKMASTTMRQLNVTTEFCCGLRTVDLQGCEFGLCGLSIC